MLSLSLRLIRSLLRLLKRIMCLFRFKCDVSTIYSCLFAVDSKWKFINRRALTTIAHPRTTNSIVSIAEREMRLEYLWLCPSFVSTITKRSDEWRKINSNRVVNWIELYLSFPNDALFEANRSTIESNRISLELSNDFETIISSLNTIEANQRFEAIINFSQKHNIATFVLEVRDYTNTALIEYWSKYLRTRRSLIIIIRAFTHIWKWSARLKFGPIDNVW